MKLNKSESDILVAYAFRYALSRNTYASEEMLDFVRSRWQELEPNTRNIIRREIKLEIEREDRTKELRNHLPWQGYQVWKEFLASEIVSKVVD